MVDLRNISKHNESDNGGLIDVLIGLFAVALFLVVLSVLWKVLPGCRTIDEVMQIEPPRAHYYHPTTHHMTFIDQEADK